MIRCPSLQTTQEQVQTFQAKSEEFNVKFKTEGPSCVGLDLDKGQWITAMVYISICLLVSIRLSLFSLHVLHTLYPLPSTPHLPLYPLPSSPIFLSLPSSSLSPSFLFHLPLYPSPSLHLLSIPFLPLHIFPLPPSYFLSHLPLYPPPTSSPILLSIPSFFLSTSHFLSPSFLSHLLFIPSFHHPLSSRSNPPKAVSGYVL